MIRPNATVTPRDVAAHYDDLDRMYRDIWGEHVHHGYWVTGRESAGAAVVALAELVGDRLGLSEGLALCDIGCGYGATAQLFAEQHAVHVTGVTLSRAQAEVAGRRMATRGSLAFSVRDWLANGFADAMFDRAYAIESSEHMEDKAGFFREAHRVLRPGGRLAVCAWLARDQPRSWEVRHLLEPICREGRLPGMGSEAEYRSLAEAAGFQVAGVRDISRQVRRTWALCLGRIAGKLATDLSYWRYLLNPRAGNRVFLLTLVRLLAAYRTGSIAIACWCCTSRSRATDGAPPALSRSMRQEERAMQADTEHSTDMAEQVRELAYHLWLQEGQPEGREEEFWLRAEQRLRAAESPPVVETEPADEHDETAAQSFPASDPPSSTPAASTVASVQHMPEKKRRKA